MSDLPNIPVRPAAPLRAWVLVATAVAALLLVVAGVGATVAFYELAGDRPEPYEDPPEHPATELRRAYAQYMVGDRPTAVISDVEFDAREFDVLRNTLKAYVTSRLVLERALSDPEVRESPLLASFDNPIEELEERVVAYYPADGKIFEIALPDDSAAEEDLLAIVNAVSKAFYEEVVFKHQTDDALPLQLMRSALQVTGDRLRKEQFAFQSLETQDEAGNAPLVDAARRRIETLAAFEAELQTLIYRAEVDQKAPGRIQSIGPRRAGYAIAEMHPKVPSIPGAEPF